jgi:hypothetical protein
MRLPVSGGTSFDSTDHLVACGRDRDCRGLSILSLKMHLLLLICAMSFDKGADK